MTYSGVWGGGFKTLAGGPSACCGLGYTVPRSCSVGLAVGSQHLFMVRGSGDHMTQPILVQNFVGRLLPGVTRARGALFVLSKGVWTVSTLTSALRNVYVPDSHTLHLDV